MFLSAVRFCLGACVCFFLFPLLPAHGVTVHHDLRVSLFPNQKKLSGSDRIEIGSNPGGPLRFTLAEQAELHEVKANGKPESFSFSSGLLSIGPIDGEEKASTVVEIRYEGIFDDPLPVNPLNTDNPGYGVNGTISHKGTFLQAGAGWYPEFASGNSPLATYSLVVDAPSGVISVSAGASRGHETRGGRTISRWETKRPTEGLSLSAARYVVQEREVGGIKAATYFFPDSVYLSGQYLDAIARYIALYDGLFGPYPFEKFAVVENFFPTGYGFPSYTLLGSSVLRLPFIVHTSLGHEIAHCWWGNGVYVDYRQGNWSEGLTTYVSDYLYKEMASKEEAREYRLKMLRDYAALVKPNRGFPLRAFQSRNDPVSKAIGYDKGAMVFHMVRRRIGDDAFWAALRDVYREKRFKLAAWADFKRAFEGRGKTSLDRFFHQWIDRKGAPELSLSDVGLASGAGVVKGILEQKTTPYELSLPYLLETKEGRHMGKILVSDAEDPFDIPCEASPSKLSIDPGYDVFRRLAPSEIPPSVNSLKGSSSLLLVLPEGSPEGVKREAEAFALSLGLKRYEIVGEKEVSGRKLDGRDLLLLGLPEIRHLLPTSPNVSVSDNSFTIDGKKYDAPSDTFFGVFRRPSSGGGVVALFLSLSQKYVMKTIRKITHYGQYSYLVFKQGEKLKTGIWPVAKSPLIYWWDRREPPSEDHS